MTEAELLADVIELCDHHGLLVFHSGDPRRDIGRGFPDVVAVGPGGCIFAEIKDQGGKLSPHQVTWKYRLLAAGQTWRLWRPDDLEAGLIEHELARIA